MKNNEKKIIAVIAVIIVVCVAAVTAVSLMYKAERDENRVVVTNSQNNTTAQMAPQQSQTQQGSEQSSNASSTVSTTTGNTTAASTSSAANGVTISAQEASGIALSDCNLNEQAVTFTKQKLDRERGGYEYEIEFNDGSTEYDYEIDAQTGKIISKSSEPLDYD